MHYTTPVDAIDLVVCMNGDLWGTCSGNSEVSNSVKVFELVMVPLIYTVKPHVASEKNNVETYVPVRAHAS